jgi:hypothetical protein
MFTVRRLGVSDRLARGPVVHEQHRVDDLRGALDHRPSHQVERHHDDPPLGPAQASSKPRIKGCKDMPILVAAIRGEVANRVSDTEIVTPEEYGHVA